MSYITRTGNLAATPELRSGDKGSYTYARVLVSDRIRQKDGSYIDGPKIPYDVSVSGAQAENLVDAAERSGNIRVTFSGTYIVDSYQPDDNSDPRPVHRVYADEIGVSLRGQRVTVESTRTN